MEPIKDWPGYFITKDGKVWSEKTHRFLAPSPNAKGYLRVCLTRPGEKKRVAIHRLVAETYIYNDNPLEKIEVNHIDENITNNNVENLEWVTPYTNLHHGTRAERIGKKNSKKILQYDLAGNYLATFDSCTEAARKYGVSLSAINNCVRGKSKSSCGFIWRSEDDE